jgi:hypothetical protein
MKLKRTDIRKTPPMGHQIALVPGVGFCVKNPRNGNILTRPREGEGVSQVLERAWEKLAVQIIHNEGVGVQWVRHDDDPNGLVSIRVNKEYYLSAYGSPESRGYDIAAHGHTLDTSTSKTSVTEALVSFASFLLWERQR